MLSIRSVPSKVAISLLLAITMVVAATPLSAENCVSTTVQGQACPQGCCAKKACCVDAREKSVPSTQPLATNATGHELSLNLAPTAAAIRFTFQSTRRGCIPSLKRFGNSHSRRAFLCTFLI